MDVKTISTKQLRENFSDVLQAMEEGRQLLLLYRSQPLAEIKPIAKIRGKRTISKSQLNQWIKDDELTKEQQNRITKIISRIS